MDTKDESLLWPNWVENLKQERQSDFLAQGTLINKQSIGQTIGRAILRGPAIAFGVRRIFNFALEDENYEEHGGRYSRSANPSHRATLNILETGNAEDKVNGILFSADAADIDDLAEREYGYDLLPVAYEQSSAQSVAFMFIARQDSKAIGHRVLDDIFPNESSLSICLAGAATYGAEFQKMWIESCLLANKTPLIDDPYYRTLVENMSGDGDIRG